MLTAEQARMARAALKLSVREVADALQFSPNTVTRVEAGGVSNKSTLSALRRLYEERGVVFVEEDDMGAGARMRDRATGENG